MQDQFIRDWSKVFINLCKNLQWNDIIRDLESASDVSMEKNYFVKYPFLPDNKFVSAIDKQKMIFYHLCYHVKAAYLANRFTEARKILRWLSSKYEKKLLLEESNMSPIMRNLKFPDFIIRTMQKIKNSAG
jgi:hypothetical protein